MGDLVYAIITYFFTGIMLDYVDHNKMALRIVASLLFLAFAIYLYFSKPRIEVSQRVAGQINQRNLSHLGSGFLLTIPNLLIVPVYVVLFSQFNFVYPLGEPPYGMFALGLISIALGALISVSYTHLDVYKRQSLCSVSWAPRGFVSSRLAKI